MKFNFFFNKNIKNFDTNLIVIEDEFGSFRFVSRRPPFVTVVSVDIL